MKKNLMFYLLLCTTAVMAQPKLEDGIKFEQGNWANTLAKAKAENKIVFVDAYTTWCGPCKKMDAETFPDKMVGDFYNKNFINCLLYTSPSPRDRQKSRMPSSA